MAQEGGGAGGRWRRREVAQEGGGAGGRWRRREVAQEGGGAGEPPEGAPGLAALRCLPSV